MSICRRSLSWWLCFTVRFARRKYSGPDIREGMAMFKLLGSVVAGMMVVGLAGSVQAAVLGWEGTLSIQIGDLPPNVGTGASIANVTTTGGNHLATLGIAGGIGLSGTVPVTDPDATPVKSIRGTLVLGSGTLLPISGGGPLALGILPVTGTAKICIILIDCSFFLALPLTAGGTRGVGLGGDPVTVGGFDVGGLAFSIQGAPWTLGVASVADTLFTPNGSTAGTTVETRAGFAHGPASLTSSTAAVSGVVQLVTPIVVSSSLGASQYTRIPGFGVLTLHFVPEPASALLVGLGVIALGVAGRRRRRPKR
jgi:hypothetical protein